MVINVSLLGFEYEKLPKYFSDLAAGVISCIAMHNYMHCNWYCTLNRANNVAIHICML